MKRCSAGWLSALLMMVGVAAAVWPSAAEAGSGRYYRRVYGRVVVRPVLVLGAGGLQVVPVVVRRSPVYYSPHRVYRRRY